MPYHIHLGFMGIRWKFVAEKERCALFNTRSFLVFWMCNKKQKGENARETKKFIFFLR